MSGRRNYVVRAHLSGTEELEELMDQLGERCDAIEAEMVGLEGWPENCVVAVRDSGPIGAMLMHVGSRPGPCCRGTRVRSSLRSRKCSVCLAIMNERWQQDLLSELETHVEILTDETLRFISSGLAAERVRSGSREITQAEVSASQDIGMGSGSLGHPLEPVSDGQASQVEPGLTGTDPTVQWEPLGAFSEFLGADFMDTYWDMQDLEATFDSSFQNPDPARQNGAFFDM